MLTYILLCSGTEMKQATPKYISYFERNVSQHQTGCILLCIRSLLHAFHTSSEYKYLFRTHCTHELTECSAACN